MSCFSGSGLMATAAVVASLSLASSAQAKVKHEGAWPASEKVTLDVSNTSRGEALRKLADAAGWSLVVHDPEGSPVELHVKQVQASKVLDLLLNDGDYVATRDGTLVSIQSGSGEAAGAMAIPPIPPIPPVPPIPPIPPMAPGAGSSAGPTDLHIQIGDNSSENDEPHAHGQDRTVMGGDVHIARGEIARDVTVFGGNVEIEGETTGDVNVFGGNVRVHGGARVRGDASVFGGTLTLDPGAKVDGDVNAVGGTFKRDPSAKVGGDVSVKGGGDSDSDSSSEPMHEHARGVLARAVDSVVDGLRLAAVLFVIGTVLLALTGRRMDQLRVEVAARPMRSIALGVLGSLGGLLVFVALCVTIIGIPVAIVGLLLAGFAILGAMCAVLSVVGEGLLRHKTENPYVHLGAGCALFVVVAAIPWVGGIAVAATVLAGIGVLVATRGAGLVPRRNVPSTPYRTADAGPS